MRWRLSRGRAIVSRLRLPVACTLAREIVALNKSAAKRLRSTGVCTQNPRRRKPGRVNDVAQNTVIIATHALITRVQRFGIIRYWFSVMTFITRSLDMETYWPSTIPTLVAPPVVL